MFEYCQECNEENCTKCNENFELLNNQCVSLKQNCKPKYYDEIK